MVRAITFDLDGVYFPSSGKANFVKTLQEHGISDDEIGRVFLNGEEMSRYKLGKMSDEAYWMWAANEWKLSMSTSELVELLVSGYQVDPEVEAAVRSARQHGYKTLVCSNNFPARVGGLQARFHFLDNFDAAIFSYEVGAAKPSEAIFTELVKRSGVAAQEIVYADDNPERLSGAKALGITTFVYKGFGKFMEDLKSLGVEL